MLFLKYFVFVFTKLKYYKANLYLFKCLKQVAFVDAHTQGSYPREEEM